MMSGEVFKFKICELANVCTGRGNWGLMHAMLAGLAAAYFVMGQLGPISCQ